MRLEPLYDKIIVLPDPELEETEAGLIIPLSAREQKNVGTVVAVGPGQLIGNPQVILPLSVKNGDKVLFNKYTGLEITLDGKKHLIMREIEVLAIMREEPDVKN
jgi:chaperonin GroES